MGAFEHFLSVRLEDEPLARAEAADVDHTVVFLWQLFQKIVFIVFRLQIDIALGALKRVKVAFYIFQRGIFIQQEADHKRRVEHFAETLLLCQIQRSTEQIDRCYFPVEQRREPITRLADVAQVDLIGLEDTSQCLNCGKVAPRVITHTDFNVGEVTRLADGVTE